MKRLKVTDIEDPLAAWIYALICARVIGEAATAKMDQLRRSATEQTNPCQARALRIEAARIKWKIRKRAWCRAKQRT